MFLLLFQVHIQTIGILVSDKSELQENLKKLLKKLQLKEGWFYLLTSLYVHIKYILCTSNICIYIQSDRSWVRPFNSAN